jgi:hypothetical protein
MDTVYKTALNKTYKNTLFETVAFYDDWSLEAKSTVYEWKSSLNEVILEIMRWTHPQKDKLFEEDDAETIQNFIAQGKITDDDKDLSDHIAKLRQHSRTATPNLPPRSVFNKFGSALGRLLQILEKKLTLYPDNLRNKIKIAFQIIHQKIPEDMWHYDNIVNMMLQLSTVAAKPWNVFLLLSLGALAVFSKIPGIPANWITRLFLVLCSLVFDLTLGRTLAYSLNRAAILWSTPDIEKVAQRLDQLRGRVFVKMKNIVSNPEFKFNLAGLVGPKERG